MDDLIVTPLGIGIKGQPKCSPKSTQPTMSDFPPSPAPSESVTSDHLPPKRKKPVINNRVDLPFANTRLTSIVYFLSAAGLILLAFYGFRLTQAKARAGGWWNLALGRHPDASFGASGHSSGYVSGVEDRIKELAELLGIQPRELALAVKPLLSEKKAGALADSKEGGGTILSVLAGTGQQAAAGGGGGISLDGLVGE